MQCPNCSSSLVAVGDGGTFVCRSCASQNNGNRALVAFSGNGNPSNLANLPDPRSTLAAATEHIEFYLNAKDQAAKEENEELASRAKEIISSHKAKLTRVFDAYTKSRSKLVEALRSKDEFEQNVKELLQKYSVKTE